MTEPGSELAAGLSGQGRLRASRADREQVIEVLKVGFVQGRLNREELGLRVGRALASRTYADLAALTADIPAPLAGAWPPEPVREPVSRAAVVVTACASAAWMGMLPVMMLRPPWPSFVLPVAVVWFALVMAVPVGWLALLRDWLDKRARCQAVRARAAARRGRYGIPAPGTG